MSIGKEEPPKTSPSRRGFIRLVGFAALVGAAYGGTALLRRLTEPGLEYEPIAGIPGFRRIAGGPISGGSAVMVGIGGTDDKVEISNTKLCDALFRGPPQQGSVPIAYFTDYRCVYCRKVSPMLAQMEAQGGIHVTWHDLPLLGPASVAGARAALAARAQGAYQMFHDRLMGTPVVPTPPYLRQLSEEAGIDADRLLRDMSSDETEHQLKTTAALARRFGFIGTPALVIGRTAILGGIDQRKVERLIEAERNLPRSNACAA